MSPSRSRSEQVVGNSHDTDARGAAQLKSSGSTTSSTGPAGSLLRCVCLTSGERIDEARARGIYARRAPRCKFAWCLRPDRRAGRLPLQRFARPRAGLAQQRFRDFLLENVEVERPAAALSASLCR
jgi:hypothetical protein